MATPCQQIFKDTVAEATTATNRPPHSYAHAVKFAKAGESLHDASTCSKLKSWCCYTTLLTTVYTRRVTKVCKGFLGEALPAFPKVSDGMHGTRTEWPNSFLSERGLRFRRQVLSIEATAEQIEINFWRLLLFWPSELFADIHRLSSCTCREARPMSWIYTR